tara:strand:- start:12297 stop:13601 length:1305 start_codon:yes stop_codon:yes gene_type:complete
MLKKIFRSYHNLPWDIHLLILMEFTLSLIHVAFILILNIFLRKQGYSDPEIASFNSLRFMGALAFALPLGIYIRGKKLKPLFILSAFVVPLTSGLIIQSVHNQIVPMIQLGFLSWGFGMMLMRVCALPFILRNTTSENSTEALSLSAATWSLATIFSGLIISSLDWVGYLKIGEWKFIMNEYTTLWFITILGASSIFFALMIKESNQQRLGKNNDLFLIHKSYDWSVIFKAISPLILISVGAGLTIPFVNLFFNSVFGLGSREFSLLGSVTALFVFIFSLSVPYLRKKYGYWLTIVVVQSLAICCLVVMALMELYVDFSFALMVAIIAFIFRQPLMHMAHPASNELMMNYVGKKNQELVSALSSSLWSASWFISAKLFEWLRLLNYRYFEIFLITATFYIIGVILYAKLISEYQDINNRKSSQIIPLTDELTID